MHLGARNTRAQDCQVAAARYALQAPRMVRAALVSLHCRTRRYVGQTTKTGADVAMINSGGIRASVDAGDITTADVYAVFPYGNLVSLISVTGAQLLAALENSASVDFSNPSGKFSQVWHGTVRLGGAHTRAHARLLEVVVSRRQVSLYGTSRVYGPSTCGAMPRTIM